MEAVKWTYYQFRKAYSYSVYVRFKDSETNSKLTHLLSEMGFTALTEKESRKISLQRGDTKILTVQEASSRLEQQINGSDLMDKYGSESLSIQLNTPVYTYRKVGIMVMPANKGLWDLALHSSISHTDQMVGLRVIIVRFLSQALADQGVLSYWGTVKNDSVIIMKQATSFGEALFIDCSNRVVFSNGGEMKIHSSLKIVRKDKEAPIKTYMSREDMIGFMSVSTCLLSFNGISYPMKKAIYDISANASGTYSVTENVSNL
jgi:hypothetical protein